MTHSRYTTSIQLSSYNGRSRQGFKPKKGVIHHMAGWFNTGVNYMKNPNSRDSCANYAVGDGQVVCLIDEDFCPSSTGWNVDKDSLTIEIGNSSIGGDWPVLQSSLESVAALFADWSIKYGWGELRSGVNVVWHQMYSATACPGPFVLARIGWIVTRANQIRAELLGNTTPVTPPAAGTYTVVKSIPGYTNAANAAARVSSNSTVPAGTYSIFKNASGMVNVTRKAGVPGWWINPADNVNVVAPPAGKSVDTLAREVLAGQWGNGADRRARLTAAGYNYDAVQAQVNAILNGSAPSAPARKSNDDIAREIWAGKGNWGTGATRAARLRAAGYDPSAVQASINRLFY